MGLAKAKQIGSVVNLTQEDMDKHQKLLVDKMAAAEQGLKAKPDIIFQGHKISESVSNPDNFTLITHGT